MPTTKAWVLALLAGASAYGYNDAASAVQSADERSCCADIRSQCYHDTAQYHNAGAEYYNALAYDGATANNSTFADDPEANNFNARSFDADTDNANAYSFYINACSNDIDTDTYNIDTDAIHIDTDTNDVDTDANNINADTYNTDTDTYNTTYNTDADTDNINADAIHIDTDTNDVDADTNYINADPDNIDADPDDVISFPNDCGTSTDDSIADQVTVALYDTETPPPTITESSTPVVTADNLGDQPTALPERRPGNRSNWPALKLETTTPTTNVFQVVANALLIPSLVSLAAFHFGWWSLPTPVLLPAVVPFAQHLAAFSFVNLDTTAVPPSTLGFSDGLTWINFIVPGTRNATAPARRLEAAVGSGAEFFAFRADLNERRLFGYTWLAVGVVAGALVILGLLCRGCARFVLRDPSFAPAVASMRARASRLFAMALFVASAAVFPLALTAAYEVRQDAYTPTGPHASGILACITLFTVVFMLLGLFYVLFMEDAYKYEAFAAAEGAWWTFAAVKYRRRCFPVLLLALQFVTGAVVGGFASRHLLLVLLVLRLLAMGTTWWLQPFTSTLLLRVYLALDAALALCLLSVWVATAVSNSLGYTVVVALLVFLAIALHQMMLIFSLVSATCCQRRRQPRRVDAYADAPTTRAQHRGPDETRRPAHRSGGPRMPPTRAPEATGVDATWRPKRHTTSNRGRLPPRPAPTSP
ncbi:hypothetical protein ACHHYP_03782 [Achlya hypogyna]|uniref:TRP C-terminal domain-containing protein n=1 Tax=Achlya hypogyna TaxID=1202772 RepID=A0A1V9Z385_ACHHY|nr:hypothetical protein ACHHYP_03782 [Achlya hypogyna]